MQPIPATRPRGAVSGGLGGSAVSGLGPCPGVFELELSTVTRATPDGAGASWRRGEGHHPIRSHPHQDRKSTRLNSSHVEISYAVFCLKKKKKITTRSSFKKKTKPQKNPS